MSEVDRVGKALAYRASGTMDLYLYADGSGGYVLVDKAGELAVPGPDGRPDFDALAKDLEDANLWHAVTSEAKRVFGLTRTRGVKKSIGQHAPDP